MNKNFIKKTKLDIILYFLPLLIVPLISPFWGEMVGFYYIFPVLFVAYTWPMALIFFITAALFCRAKVEYLKILHWEKSEEDLERMVLEDRNSTTKYETLLGQAILVMIASYLYYLAIALYCGLEVISLVDALKFNALLSEGSAYDF